MGYTALLFCPDEKTARTVTQVLNELDFAVEPCTEPFAAVKKLMGQHFDAVVVDCDHEQNATLLFKSARNSTPNQASLAVAVVEGQAGVAKAFRIGANLVLTKPINIEQTKGTLRVARGLLRKSDPVKPGTPASSASTPEPATKSTAAKPVAEPRLPAAASAAPSFVSRPVAAVPVSKPTQDDDLLGIDDDQAPARPAAATASRGIPAPPRVPTVEAKPISASSSRLSSSGAASAPAPAREPERPSKDFSGIVIPEKPAESSAVQPAGIIGSAPNFGYGSAGTTSASSGGVKKIVIGVAAALALAAGAYAGWAHLHGAQNQAAVSNSSDAASTAALPTPQEPSRASEKKPSATTQSGPPAAASTPAESKNHKEESVTEEVASAKPAPGKTTTSAKSEGDSTPVDEKPQTPEEEPLVVKGGKVSPKHKAAATDDDAPSMIGLAAPGAAAPPPNFVPTEEAGLRPTLQTLNISQGVSQGLLIKKIAPVYPASAIRMRVEGTVELMATISKTGEITHIKVVSGHSQLTKAAVDAVKQWKYRPYLLNGEPVEIQTQITINFKLPS